MPQGNGPSLPDDVAASLSELSQLLLAEETLETTLNRVASLTVRAIPDCDYGGVSLLTKKGVQTAAATDPIVNEVDIIQYELDDGPCMSSMRQRTVVEMRSLAEDDRWVEFSRRALTAGIASVLSLPLVALDHGIGGLNLYSKKDRGFTDVDRAIGNLFAAQAAIAIANAQTYDETKKLADQLAQALESRAVIDQAKGILMEREGIGPDDAFDMLRRQSQHTNIKVNEVARRIVAAAGPPAKPDK